MSEENDLHIVLKVVCFLIPLVGLVLFFVHKSEAPTKSKSAGVWALAGFALGLVIKILT